MLTKMVNGISVVMSPEEELATRAEWLENSQRPPTPKVLTDGALAAVLVAKGVISTADVAAAMDQVIKQP